MNFASFGYGLAGALQGYRDTTGLIQNVRQNVNERQVRDQVEKGMDAAAQDRQSALEGLINPDTDSSGKTTGYTVGKHSFKSQADAEKFAGNLVGSTMDFFNKSYAPSIQDTFMKQGNVAGADRWQQYVQDQSTQTGQRFLARANLARLMGDNTGMISNLMSAINSAPGAQGYKITGADPVTDDKGNVTAYNLSVMEPDGTVSQRQIDGGADGIWNLGSSFLAPATQFDYWHQGKVAAAKLAGDAAIENLKGSYGEGTAAITGNSRVQAAGVRNEGLVAREKLANDGAKDRALLGYANAGAGTSGAIQAKIDALTSAGYTPEQIKSMVPALTGGMGKTSDGRDPGKTYDTMLDNAEKNNFGDTPVDPSTITDAAIKANQARQAVVKAAQTGGGSTGVTGLGPAVGATPDGTGTATPNPNVNSTLGLPLYDPSQPDDSQDEGDN